MNEAESGAMTLALGNERKLSFLGLWVSIITSSPRALFGLLALYFVIKKDAGSGAGLYLLLAVAIIMAVIFGLQWLIWSRFSYVVEEDAIRIQQGVLNRQVRTIPYERIADVSLEQALVPRIFGLAEVKFETGGGKGDEAKLTYVSLAEADALRDLVRARKAGASHKSIAEDIQDTDAEVPPPLFFMDSKRVATLGLYSFSLFIIAIIGGVINQFDFLLPFDPWEVGKWIGMAENSGFNFEALSWTSRIIGLVAILLALIPLGIASGMIRAFLANHGFRLDYNPRGFRRRRGLLTLTDVIMPLHRVQAAIIETGPIRKKRGWHAFKFISLAQDSSSKQGNEGKVDQDHVVAPFAQWHEIERIAAAAHVHLPPVDMAYQSAMRAHWVGSFIISAIVILAGFSIGAVISGYTILWLAAAGVIALVALWHWLEWRAAKHAEDENRLYVREAWWRQRLTTAPKLNIQSVTLAQGPLARLCGYAELKFGLAGGHLSIPAIPLEDARALQKELIAVIAPVGYSKITRKT